MSIILQLVKIYLEEENWHKTKLSSEEAIKYFCRLIDKGRVLWHLDDGEVVGYVESWRVTYEQFGRIICGAPFSAYGEDVETGNICYVANCWCHPDYRRSGVSKSVRDRYFEQNKYCDYFVGDARRKKTGLIKVFKTSDIYFKGGNDGKGTHDYRGDFSTANNCAGNA